MDNGTPVLVSSDYLPVRVFTKGKIEDWRPGKKLALVLLDYYDGCWGSCELIPKKDLVKMS